MKSLSFLTLSIFTLSTFFFIADTASASSGCTIPLDELNTGKYYYMNDRSYSVVFDIQLNQISDSGTFTGTITEENTFQENAGPILNASIVGECRGDRIQFAKTYLFTGGHTIKYLGRYSKKMKLIMGRWSIGLGNNTGGWIVSNQ